MHLLFIFFLFLFLSPTSFCFQSKFLLKLKLCSTFTLKMTSNRQRSSLIPGDKELNPSNIEILRVLGKIDLQIDSSGLDETKIEIEKTGDIDALDSFVKWMGGERSINTKSTSSSNAGRITSVRIFEARILGNDKYEKCFLKEYLPSGIMFGKRELSTTRRLTRKWNELQRLSLGLPANDKNDRNNNPLSNGKENELMKMFLAEYNNDDNNNNKNNNNNSKSNSNSNNNESINDDKYDLDEEESNDFDDNSNENKGGQRLSIQPFPILIGSLRTDERIEEDDFRISWLSRFPRTPPPGAGNLWLIFQWDTSSFKNLKIYPRLPQVVEGLDYFRKDQRIFKRWKFIRKIMKGALESLGFIHRSGYCHNAISTESTWMSTTNQQEIDNLHLKISDLGASQRLADLGPIGSREGIAEDMYQLGFVFLQLILSSMADEDNVGAQMTRAKLNNEEYKMNIFAKAEEINFTQLSQRELQALYENICENDFQSLREYVGSIKNWKDAYELLENNQGAAWKLIFNLLARGRLYDEDKEKPLKVTCNTLLKDFRDTLFNDI